MRRVRTHTHYDKSVRERERKREQTGIKCPLRRLLWALTGVNGQKGHNQQTPKQRTFQQHYIMKMALTAAHLNAGVTLVVAVWR